MGVYQLCVSAIYGHMEALLGNCKFLKKEDPRAKVTDKHLEAIARFLPAEEWKMLAPYLHMDRITVENIDHDNKTQAMKKYNFLCKWSDTMGSDATYEALIEGINQVHSSS